MLNASEKIVPFMCKDPDKNHGFSFGGWEKKMPHSPGSPVFAPGKPKEVIWEWWGLSPLVTQANWIFSGKWDSPSFLSGFCLPWGPWVWDFDMNWAIDPWSLAAEYPFSLFLPGKRIVGRHGKSLIEAPPISSFWCVMDPDPHTFAAVCSGKSTIWFENCPITARICREFCSNVWWHPLSYIIYPCISRLGGVTF